MEQPISRSTFLKRLQHLQPDCSKCFGLCCTALYFSKQDGFPADKKAETPCPNLTSEYRCGIHDTLRSSGCKGCVSYECFGAGQQVSQVTFQGHSWREVPSSSGCMFRVFFIMQQLYEIDWYLNEASLLALESPYREQVQDALFQTQTVTQSAPQSLLEFDLSAYHDKIGALLTEISSFVRNQKGHVLHIHAEKRTYARKDFIGKDLRKMDLRCADLRGAFLIAADLRGADLTGTDFLGADLRDTNLKGANLSDSIFLTQPQINEAKGDFETQLPSPLSHPSYWR